MEPVVAVIIVITAAELPLNGSARAILAFALMVSMLSKQTTPAMATAKITASLMRSRRSIVHSDVGSVCSGVVPRA